MTGLQAGILTPAEQPPTEMSRDRLNFLFLGIGHFIDHLFMLIFATVAALRLADEWGMSYAALIPYAMPGFVAFGLCSIPAGWIADKWSREGMLVIFFIGIGASSIATALADSPAEIALGLFAIGVFAAIYHPVGLAMVVTDGRRPASRSRSTVSSATWGSPSRRCSPATSSTPRAAQRVRPPGRRLHRLRHRLCGLRLGRTGQAERRAQRSRTR